jgi:hypothetical protein
MRLDQFARGNPAFANEARLARSRETEEVGVHYVIVPRISR